MQDFLYFRFYTRWKEWESWYSQSFGLHFSLREEQWQEDWAFILSLASQVIMGFLFIYSLPASWLSTERLQVPQCAAFVCKGKQS